MVSWTLSGLGSKASQSSCHGACLPLVLEVRFPGKQHYHHQGTWYTCKLSVLIPDLLTLKLQGGRDARAQQCFDELSREFERVLKFDKRCLRPVPLKI